MKKAFINNEIWILTFGGGFQRSNAYIATSESSQRTEFRKALRKEIENIVQKQYVANEVSAHEHLTHIESIVEFTKDYGVKHPNLLTNNQLNIGIVQKIFNLYLKYLWCLEKIQTPPHFPVDRIIQELLIKELKELNEPTFELKPWTKFESIEEYMLVINNAKAVMKRKGIYSLAELELELFDRRK